MKKNFNKGFTLIELIIVMVILGVLASVAVPRYLDSIANAEESAENAVINSIRNGLKQYAGDMLYKEGRATWPDNPFETLSETPPGYNSSDNGFEPGVDQLDGVADTDGEWTFDYDNSRITHQRADNSRYYWAYDKGEQDGDNAGIGSLGNREEL
jgi:prepilin-type N-terminal cleavage/methylation domain-containing protein|tara:strand:- start:1614 stop:2078 length:465 start_codon:yes stop_codon:yes gene_type:complete